MKRYWLFKSDFEDYPLKQFMKDKVTAWEGVRNYQARNYMMNDMRPGDLGIFYHSNAEPAEAVAIVEIASAAKPDKLALDKKSDYYDEKATKENPRWFCVDVKFVAAFKKPVTIDEMRGEKSLGKMPLLQRGNRLSVTPVSESEFNRLREMGNC